MGLRQCDSCGDQFDEAKAFCPGCGKAFVEEQQREKRSDFEKQSSTVQIGKTMYNQMLADMGLAKPAAPVEKRVEVIAPVGEPAAAKAKETQAPAQPVSTSTASGSKPSGGKAKWIVLGVIGVILLLPLALVSTVALVYEVLLRLR